MSREEARCAAEPFSFCSLSAAGQLADMYEAQARGGGLLRPAEAAKATDNGGDEAAGSDNDDEAEDGSDADGTELRDRRAAADGDASFL